MLLSSQTGAEKTELVQALASAGAQAVDLEDLAQHRGSAFGNIGLGDQPAQQNFENGLAEPGSQHYRWSKTKSRGIRQITIPQPV